MIFVLIFLAVSVQMYNKFKISQQNPLYFQCLRHKNKKNVQKMRGGVRKSYHKAPNRLGFSLALHCFGYAQSRLRL